MVTLQTKSLLLKTLFDLHSSKNAPPNTVLAEVGGDYCCVALANKDSKSINRLTYFSLEGEHLPQSLSAVLKEHIGTDIVKAVVCSAYPEALLVPQTVFSNENNIELLSSIYTITGSVVKHDVVQEWQLATLYAVPQPIEQWFNEQFTDTDFIHTYTTLVKKSNYFIAESNLSIQFMPKSFMVLVNKKERLQLVQAYQYTTPLDVVYYLLKIFEAFSLAQEETRISISGLVEENSALFKALHDYFLHVQFAEIPKVVLEQNTHPQHFFTSMYNLASCVL